MKVRILLSYEGTNFLGWQRQKRGRTVQNELEKALENLFQEKIKIFASGRTDQGVHALGQVIHFEIPKHKTKNINLIKALNHLTPSDISLMEAWKAPEEFHARFSAEKKTYIFLISTQKTPPALCRHFLWWQPMPLDIEKLKRMSQTLLGRHNFQSFQTASSPALNTVRTIYEAHWKEIRPSVFCFTVTGSGFLRQMVRNIVGAQVEILKQGTSVGKFQEILKSKDRSCAFSPAASCGLYLKEVFYPQALDRQCVRL